MAQAFGIDFGTTNSAVVEYVNGRFVNVGDYDSNPFPSVVMIDRLTQKVSCGREVKERIIELREQHNCIVVESVKTFLASDDFRQVSGTKTMTAENVAAELFKVLSAKAEKLAGEPISEAVVAIPVGMTSEKRAALRRAARAAGIEVRSFVSEPTAAFVAHAENLRHCKYVVVFDWGGGTLDISILEAQGDSIIERYTCGWEIAGDYIDRRFAEWLHLRFAEEHGINVAFHSIEPKDRQRLINAAERYKRELQSDTERVKIALGNYAGARMISQEVSQDEFDDLIRGIINDAVDLLIASVEKAGLSMKEIGKLIIVGGSSNLLSLRRELEKRWPQPNMIFPPKAEWDVARGAAWLAAHPGCYKTAESVGLVLADGEYYEILQAGTLLQDAGCRLHFGLIEDTRTATFLFALRDGRNHRAVHIGELYIDTFGFSNELINLDCRITEDLVFEAVGHSEFKPQAARQFVYNNLRLMYKLPKGD